MSRNDIEKRLAALEQRVDETPPLIILLDCVDASAGRDPDAPRDIISAVVTGSGQNHGTMLHREEGETSEEFEERAEAHAKRQRGIVSTVELRG
ncbi:hypothetical protein P1P91_10925 [Halomonas piscis]|uniref:Uncharacterized protein n=1 Tax=Halomonas piscis TaxID=3031727 RepID=A0ABY9YWV5_9GAMM|nr:hypothetical protein [Halomonas piscis]WNK19365.1 hypothetical protein P1P91_10925 [Halomonas piscis]